MTRPNLEWSESFSTDIESIDDQHKVLIQCAQAFIEALDIEADYDTVYRLFHELADEALQHFDSEERVMKNIGLASLGEHLKEHDDLRREITNIGRMIENQTNEGEWKALASTIQVWLMRHIMASDTKIKTHLHKNPNED